MKYIKYELRKLFGMRYIWIFLIVFLAANIGLCIYTINQNVARQIPNNEINKFFELYKAEPERIEAEYEALILMKEEHDRLLQEAMEKHDFDYEPEPLPNKYIESEIYNDLSLFNEVFDRKKYISEYPSAIQKVIERAYSNITELNSMGISSDSYSYQYQLEVIDIYKNAQSKVRMEFEYTRGWENYFSYDIVNIFIFTVLIMIGSVIFTNEKNSGFLSIIRTAKNGRAKTAAAKIGAMLLLTALVVLFFTLSTLAVFGIKLGYSSPANAIQVFSDFTLSPFIVSVGQYFIITIAVKILVFTLFSSLILLMSIFLYNYALINICSFGLFGLNFFLYTLRYTNADNPLKNLNLIAIAAVNPLFVRYRSLNFFGSVCSYVPLMIVIFIMLLFISSAVTVVMFSSGYAGFKLNKFVFIANATNKCKSTAVHIFENMKTVFPQRKYHSNSLFLAEIYKTLISSRYIFLVIVLFTVNVSNSEFVPQNSYADAVYKEYMTTLEGELTDEKIKYITDERAFIDETMGKAEAMRDEYIKGTVTFEEYIAYLNDYNYAYSRNEYLAVIEGHKFYIEQTKAENGIDVWFVYDTGWKLLYHSSFDVILYIVILLLFNGIFVNEYSSKSSSGSFAQILRSTKYGRKRTFVSKYASTASLVVVFSVIWNTVDFMAMWKNYGLPAINAPLLSIQTFAQVKSEITIIQYLIIFFMLRILASVMFSTLICSISEFIRKSIPVISLTISITLFPALLAHFGLSTARYVDYTAFLAVTPLYLLSAVAGLIGDMGLLVLFIVGISTVIAAVVIRSYRTYVK